MERPMIAADSVETTEREYVRRRALVFSALVVAITAAAVLAWAMSGEPAASPAEAESSAPEPVGATETPEPVTPIEVPPATPPNEPENPTQGEAEPEVRSLVENPIDPTLRHFSQQPQQILDTRTAGEPPSPGSSQTVSAPVGRTSVAILVSVTDTATAGSVTIDGSLNLVEAITYGGPGATKTTLVVVPVRGATLTFTSSGGGHLIAEVVGTFLPDQDSPAGRFRPDPLRIARLDTATEGRETTLRFDSLNAGDTPGAVLMVIKADVGDDGGTITVGSDVENVQTVRWGGAKGADNQRQVVVLVKPADDGSAYLRYEGGTLLTVDTLGYYTPG